MNNYHDSAQHNVIFVDPMSQRLLLLAQKVAQANVSVLLTGPTGAGKEVLARIIHETSNRCRGPLVSINCGALPEHLVEDMLFGHEKGAFSGAIRDHTGLFEQAQGGTVFLDEIGEMPLHLQTRLLRVLQERKVTRLGSQHAIDVDVRVIVATNKDLKQAMHRHEFREDLYYRISTFTLKLLPLKERPQDIPALAAHFLELYGTPKLPCSITEAALQQLMSYSWPGNVRELANIIQRALVVCPDTMIDTQHLIFDEQQFNPLFEADWALSDSDSKTTAIPPAMPLPEQAAPAHIIGLQWAVKNTEYQAIADAIRNSVSREAAAKTLGISSRTLRYKIAQMRDLGMVPAELAI
jgi:two-component system response regulator FlrC